MLASWYKLPFSESLVVARGAGHGLIHTAQAHSYHYLIFQQLSVPSVCSNTTTRTHQRSRSVTFVFSTATSSRAHVLPILTSERLPT
jgi:hypothetical protein